MKIRNMTSLKRKSFRKIKHDISRDEEPAVDHSVDLSNVKLEPCDDIDINALGSDAAAINSLSLNDCTGVTDHNTVVGQVAMDTDIDRVAEELLLMQTQDKNLLVERARPKRYGVKTMNLDKIWSLNDKQLVSLFAEPASNELSRNFAYTCALMPQTCSAIFTSFGSELKARAAIKEHLLDHLRHLIAQSRANPKFTFSAQTVQGRKKCGNNLGSVRGPYKKRKNRDLNSLSPVDKQSITRTLDVSPKDKLTEKYLSTTRNGNVVLIRQPTINNDNNDNNNSLNDVINSQQLRNARSRLAAAIDQNRRPTTTTTTTTTTADCLLGSLQPTDIKREPMEGVINPDHPYAVGLSDVSCDLLTDLTGNIDRSELSRTSGRKYGLSDCSAAGVDTDDIDNQLLNVIVRLRASRAPPIASRLVIPIVRVPRATLLSRGVTLQQTLRTDMDDDTHSEAFVASGENVSGRNILNIQRKCMIRQRMRSYGHANEIERNLALRYIRDLRMRRGVDEPLVCKICRSKVFTAVATLMYHYRSHAGIKPFVCLICNTTFTRQHSLNYHMLIHNNQNRFTCKECGRMFRHPSHFKEHMRRHTGETPFHCADCPLRFKTRNTYKRHLRTRHGKQLLTDGIRVLSRDEFLQVRTKPYLNELNTELEEGDSNEDGNESDIADENIPGGITIIAEQDVTPSYNL